MKVLLATAAVLIAATLTSAANADNYGTTKKEAARMTALVYKTFGSGWEGRCMARIMMRESGGNYRAINWRDSHANGPGSFGLFQIGRIHVGMVGGDWRRLLDPATNIRVAHRLYTTSGFGPWRGCP